MSAGALGDVRVLDLTRLLPGGFCSLLMADLGADVVKVEDTGMGDYVRWAPPYYGSDEQQGLGTRSALYLALNRGKRSIRIDLKCSTGWAAATTCCARRTRASSTARSPATGRPGPRPRPPATT
jgi:crotonobetainyl-CoA:carnitine CoA-transferase CaiB-like acyl-CoA transferase